MSKQKVYAPRRRNWFRPTLFGREVPLFWIPILVVCWMLVTHFLIRTEIQMWAEHFLGNYSWIGATRHGAVDYELNGRIEVRSLAIEPDADDSEATITIDRISVQTPGRMWLTPSEDPQPAPKKQRPRCICHANSYKNRRRATS